MEYHKFIFVFVFIFLNQLITAVVLFHYCSCNLFRNSLLMFSGITLLILPISFFGGLMSLSVALFSKFSLWSFNVMKHSSFPLTWILSRMWNCGKDVHISLWLFYKNWISYQPVLTFFLTM